MCVNCPVQKTIETRLNQWNLKKEPSPSGGIQYLAQRTVPILKNGNMVNILEIMVDRTEQERYKAKAEKNFFDTIEVLISLIELYDGYTGGHSNTVKNISVLISKELNLSEEDKKFIQIASVLHDIGKIGINCSIINKKTNLTNMEFEIIKKHPAIGENAIKYIDGFNKPREIIRHHHERYNGTGYPDGLKGEEIPLGSRILSIADAFDAMTSNRPYRNTMHMKTQ